MLNIRLSRIGKKNYAQYKIVVAEKTSPVKGKFVEQLGSYDPHTKEIVAKEDRIKYWISKGAGCSETVHNLLVEKKIIEGEKTKLTLKSKKKEGEGEGDEKVEKTDKAEASAENSADNKEVEKEDSKPAKDEQKVDKSEDKSDDKGDKKEDDEKVEEK